LIVSVHKRKRQELSQLLFAAGAGAIEELDHPHRLVVYGATREELADLADRARSLLAERALLERVQLSIEVDEASRWDTAWADHLRPVALTPRLTIQPAGDETPAPEGATIIRFEPKLAFGDGGHATTRLAARALEEHCHALSGVRVLDYGCGTGVLAFVALRSGARQALGLDVDPVAVAAARANAALNGLSERARFELVTDFSDSERFELCVANLELPVLRGLYAELTRAAVRAERLLLTGFLSEHSEEVGSAFQARGFRTVCAHEEAGWTLLELTPAGGNQSHG
jgi:ribosomal protein L11 methyltransferase